MPQLIAVVVTDRGRGAEGVVVVENNEVLLDKYHELKKTEPTAKEKREAKRLQEVPLKTVESRPRKRRTQKEVAENSRVRRETGRVQSHKHGRQIPTTVYLPVAVSDKLAELVFLNRKEKISRNDIVIAAIDLYLKDHGLEGVNALIEKSESVKSSA